MRKALCLILTILFSKGIIAQYQAIDVAENTLKVSPVSDEIFYYGFAEGDQLIFNFFEVNGKELKELEISGINSSTLFLDYKSKKIENKTLTIPETGIYKFRFSNSNLLAGRICKFKIQRIPATEESRKFNSTVYKRQVNDTAYYEVDERYLVKTDTIVTEVLSQTAKVHSTLNANGNRTFTNFSLPPNTISWSYYIGVDQAGQEAYEIAANKLSKSAGTITKLVGGSPLAALALGLPSYLSQWQRGEDIDYYLMATEYTPLFSAGQPFKYYKKGLVVNDFAMMLPIKENLTFCFTNDNAVQGVQVIVKVTAIHLEQQWDNRRVRKATITAREEMYLKP